jgi:hypothetical protein
MDKALIVRNISGEGIFIEKIMVILRQVFELIFIKMRVNILSVTIRRFRIVHKKYMKK